MLCELRERPTPGCMRRLSTDRQGEEKEVATERNMQWTRGRKQQLEGERELYIYDGNGSLQGAQLFHTDKTKKDCKEWFHGNRIRYAKLKKQRTVFDGVVPNEDIVRNKQEGTKWVTENNEKWEGNGTGRNSTAWLGCGVADWYKRKYQRNGRHVMSSSVVCQA